MSACVFTRSAMDPGSAMSGAQFYDSDRIPAAIWMLGRDSVDERMVAEEFAKTAPKSAGSVAVNDAKSRTMRERCIIEEFVDKLGRSFHGQADDVDLRSGRPARCIRCALHGDASRRRAKRD